MRGPGGGIQDQVRQTGQVIFLFGDESVHCRGRALRPGSLGDLRDEHGLFDTLPHAEEAQGITVVGEASAADVRERAATV